MIDGASHSSSDDPTMLSAESLSAAGPATETAPQLPAGQTFGAYRIERLLGRGGMGEVYEAEHSEQGRRIALKVLNQRLASREDRARFLREGQLAASVSHPNSVYIYGSEEIGGVPVIAMELLPGGTLKDRVSKGGPLPAGAAVDAILQTIAGLDAAQAKGVLHRDIKPSNCFVTRDGSVKIGDFGLSISTMARDATQIMLTTLGTFHGTPQYASPEQIKGLPLDVRADIYSVGATLFYLLTGKPAFDGPDLLAVATRIATDPPPSPQTLQPTVSRALAAIVVACLAKNPADRPASYRILADRLRPFASAAPTPGTIGRRVFAGVIDRVLLALPFMPVSVYMGLGNSNRTFIIAWTLGSTLCSLAYFGFSEGYWGQTIGKRLCRLRVVDAQGQPPGAVRAWVRAFLFLIPGLGASLPVMALGQAGIARLAVDRPLYSFLFFFIYYILTAIQFSTIRRRNGYAALHELVSGTRVVQQEQVTVRSGIVEQVTPAAATIAAIGPFKVTGLLGSTDAGELFAGRDAALQRPVWLHRLPVGAPPVVVAVRDVARPGRLRWLTGRRTESEAWDAYEALDGAPFLQVARRSHAWRTVREWLDDVLREGEAGLVDGSLGLIGADRLWITAGGTARVLDFRPPVDDRDSPAAATPSAASVKQTLSAIAQCLPAGGRGALLPLSAQQWLGELASDRTTLPVLRERLTAAAPSIDRVSRWRRAIPILVAAATTALMCLYLGFVAVLIPRSYGPQDQLMVASLKRFNASTTSAEERAALGTFIVGRFKKRIEDPATWQNPLTVGIIGPQRPAAERLIASHAPVTDAETAAAEATLAPFLDKTRKSELVPPPALMAAIGGMMNIFLLSVATVVFAFMLRSGLMLRSLGVALVTSAGREAGRFRAAWRAVVAWGPAMAAVIVTIATTRSGPAAMSSMWGHSPAAVMVIGALSIVFLAGAAWAIYSPARGLQDRLAGTWLVPR